MNRALKVLSLCLMLALVATVLLNVPSDDGFATPGDHADHDGWTEITQSYVDTNGLPTDAGNYYLAENIKITTGNWALNGDVTLCLNGYDIYADSKISLSISGSELTVCDCNTSVVRYGYWDDYTFVIDNDAPGEGVKYVEMTGGAIRTSMNDSADGNSTPTITVNSSLNLTSGNVVGGIKVFGNQSDASMHMYGGVVTGAFRTTGETDSGGIMLRAYTYNDSDASVTFEMSGGTVALNKSKSNWGGAGISTYVWDRASHTSVMDITITGGTICDNEQLTGGGGGGISLNNYSAVQFSISGATISGNTSDTAGGGGIYVGAKASGSISDCTISDNTSTGSGGGICNTSANLSVSDVTISGNTGLIGGGVFNSGQGFVLNDSVVSGNHATIQTSSNENGGGGIYTSKEMSTNSEISGNTAVNGAGVFLNACRLNLGNGTYIHDNESSGTNVQSSNVKSGAITPYGDASAISMSGRVRITDNTYAGNARNLLIGANPVEVTGALKVGDDMSEIALTWNDSAMLTHVFGTTGWGEHNEGESVTDYFTPDSDSIVISSLAVNGYDEVAFKTIAPYSITNPVGSLTYNDTQPTHYIYYKAIVTGPGLTYSDFNTYTTSYLVEEGVPVPLVVLGSSFFSSSPVQFKLTVIEDVTQATDYTVRSVLDMPAAVNGTKFNQGWYAVSNDIVVTVNKAESTCTAPVAATNLVYTEDQGEPVSQQLLATPATTSDGEMMYSINGGEVWTLYTPTASEPGTYTISYKVLGDSNHNDSAVRTVSCTIAKATVDWPDEEHITTVTYNGEERTDTVAETALYLVSQHAVGTDAGSYNGTLTLKDPDHYKWEDTDAAAKEGVLLVIERAVIAEPIECEIELLTITESFHEFTITLQDVFGAAQIPDGSEFTSNPVRVGGDDYFVYLLKKNASTLGYELEEIGTSDILTEAFRISIVSTNYEMTGEITFSTYRVAYFDPVIPGHTEFYVWADPQLDEYMSDNDFIDMGAEFAGWYTDPVLGEELADVRDADPSQDYYAHWAIDGDLIITHSLELDVLESFDLGTVSWDSVNKRLVLDGLNMQDLFLDTDFCIQLPDESIITVSDESVNSVEINSVESAYKSIIKACGDLSITRGGRLDLIGDNTCTGIEIVYDDHVLTISEADLRITAGMGIVASSFPTAGVTANIDSGSVTIYVEDSDQFEDCSSGFNKIKEMTVGSNASVTISSDPDGTYDTCGLNNFRNVYIYGNLTTTMVDFVICSDAYGDSSVTMAAGSEVTISNAEEAVEITGDLNVNGKLDITNSYVGIICSSLTAECDTIRVESIGDTVLATEVLLHSGTVLFDTVEGTAISTSNNLSITGADVTVISSLQDPGYWTIAVDGRFQIDGGELTVSSKCNGLYAYDATFDEGTVTIEALFTGIAIDGEALVVTNDMNILVSSLIATAMTAEGSLIVSNGYLELAGVTAMAVQGALEIRSGYIQCAADCDDVDAQAFYATSLSMTGGTLQVETTTNYGITANTSATFRDCVVIVEFSTPSEYNWAISADTVSITDSSITIKGRGGISSTTLTVGSDGHIANYENAGYRPESEIVPLTHETGIYNIAGGQIYSYPEVEDDVRISFHDHNWSFVLDSTSAINATCSVENACPEGNHATVRIIAPTGDLLADGYTEFPADLSRPSIDGVPAYSLVYYYKLTEGGNYESTADLTKAGFYKAALTLGDVTAYTEYKVCQSTEVEIDTLGGVYTAGAHPAQATITDPVQGADGTLLYFYTGQGYASSEAPVNAGTYTVTVSVPDGSIYALSGEVTAEFTISPKQVTISGAEAEDKVYDGNATATVTGDMSVSGKIGEDDVTIVIGTAAFSNANVGNNKDVTFAGFSLGGTAAGNYSLPNQPVAVHANITPKTLTLSGIAAENKTYDRTTDAVVIDNGQLVGVVEGDDVGYNRGTAAFADKNVGTGKTVTFTGFALTGAQKDNYLLSQPADVTANITAVSVTIIASSSDKVYDGTRNAAISNKDLAIVGVLDGDTVEIDLTNAVATFDTKDVGDNRIVSFSGFAIKGADSGNYLLSAQPADEEANIEVKVVALTGYGAADKTYNGTTDASLTGTADMSWVCGDDDVAVTVGTVAFNDRNAGDSVSVTAAGFSLTGEDAGNYELSAQPTIAPAKISKKEVTITGLSVEGKTYDGTTAATIIGNGTVVGAVGQESVLFNDGTAAFQSPNANPEAVATFTGYALMDNPVNANYVLASQPADVVAAISPKQVTITGLGAENKTYDGTANATITGSPSIDGKVGNDDVGIAVGGTAAFADKHAGLNKLVTFSGFAITGEDKDNYVLASQPSGTTASIIALHVHVEGIGAADKVYDGGIFAEITGTAIVRGFIANDNVSLDTTNARAMFNNKNAGADKEVSFEGYALTGNDSPNYVLDDVTPVSASITVKDVTIAGLNVNSRAYNGSQAAEITGNATINGKAPNDDLSVIAGTASFADKNVGTGKTVTFSGYALAGSDKDNYNLTAQPASVTANITPAPVTIRASSSDKIYDGTRDAAISDKDLAIIGVLNGETVEIDLSNASASFDTKNVGENRIVSFMGFAIKGADAGNYELSDQPADEEANIEAKPVTITGLSVSSKVYDGTVTATITGTAVIDGKVTGDDLTVIDGTASFADRNSGPTKAVTFSGFALSGADKDNYSLTAQPAGVTSTITAKPVTISGLNADSRTYNGGVDANITGNGIIEGKIANDDLSFVTGTAYFSDKNIGTGKTVTFQGFALSGADKDNYDLTAQPASVTADITPIMVTIRASTSDKVYDGTRAATISDKDLAIIGVLNGETVEIDLSNASASFSDKNVGVNKVVTFSGFAIKGADAGNYVLSVQPAAEEANIEVKPVTISGVGSSDKVYDGNASAQVTGTAAIDGMVSGDDLSFTAGTAAFSDKNAGTGKTVTFSGYALTGNDKDNYALTQPASVTADITPASLSVSGISAESKTYDGTVTATVTGQGTLNGVIGNDTVSLVSGTAAFESASVGSEKTVNFSGFSLNGADKVNYDLTQPPSVKANVTAAGLTATYVSESIDCVSTPALAVNVTGFVNGETAQTAAGYRAPAVTGSAAIGQWVLVPSGGSADNYVFEYVSGTLTVQHGSLEQKTGTVTYYECGHCHKTFINATGTVEYTPSTDNTVDIDSTINGSEVSDSAAQEVLDSITEIESASPDAEVKANFTTKDSESIGVSADIAKQIAEKGATVVMNTKGMNVEIPASLMKNIPSTSGEFSVSGTVTTDVREDMKQYITDGTIVVDVKLSVNGQSWSDFGSDKVKITVPYTLKEGESADSIRVVCLSGTEPEYFDAEYDAATSTVSFYTSHCSQFAVVPKESSSGGVNVFLIVGIVVVLLAVAGAAVFFIIKKKGAGAA